MKSHRISIVVLLNTVLIFLGGCSNIDDTLPQKEVEQLVIDKHTNGNGSPTILSVEVKGNTYYINWEKKVYLEEGTDKVDKNRNVEIVKAQIQ
ncbi:hypothetical protein [Rummeliibacillus pycnus]|uniref:hypothetical protein n=1 Tax=Rummeliibacillus pycnus TaxID=101070 RepID=UPI0037C810F2